MKKRLLSVLLCMTMAIAPVFEIGAEAVNEQLEAEMSAVVQDDTEETETVDESETVDETNGSGEISTDETTNEETTNEETTNEEITEEPEVIEEATEVTDEEDFFGDVEEILEETEETEVEADTLEASYQITVSVDDWVYDAATDGWYVVRFLAEAEEQELSSDVLEAEEDDAVEEITDASEEIESERMESMYYDNPGVYDITTTNGFGTEISSGRYYISKSGKLLQGMITNDGSSYFFKTKEYASSNADSDEEMLTPFDSDYLSAAMDEYIWDGEVFRFYSPLDGSLVPCNVEGICEISYKGEDYKFYMEPQSDGSAKPVTGDYTDEAGNEYYFDKEATVASEVEGVDDIPGKMHTGWLYEKDDIGERWRNYTADGTRKKPGITISKLDKNLNSNVVENAYYLLDADGYIIKSDMALAHNGAYYGSNKDGIIYRNKAVTYNGAMYYFDKYGKRAANQLIKYTNGYRYYFGSDGKRVSWKNEWHAIAGGKVYYFGSAYGRVQEKTGWQLAKMNGKTYGWLYFSKSGEPYQDKLVNDYYFNKACKLVGGKYIVNGLPYYFLKSTSKVRRGKMVKGKLIQDGDKYYGASGSGVLYGYNGLDKWAKLNNAWYCFQGGTCEAYTKKFVKFLDGRYGYCGASGKWVTGWYIVSDSKNQVRYIRSDAPGYYKNTTATIGGKNYRFDKNGYRVNDRSSEFSGPYFVKVDRVNCVMTVYTSSDMKTPVKSIRVSVGLPATPTPTGYATITRAGRWQMLMGPSWGQYACHVRGGIYIHSVACAAANSYNLSPYEYNRLGYPASHGCIRVCVGDAYWCYNNLPGSEINVFDGKSSSYESFKGPLGKPALTPMYGSMNFDPTDPNL